MATRCCDAAKEVLLETDNPAVMWGDVALLHMIAERMGWDSQGAKTERRVLAALSRCPGPFTPGKTTLGNGRTVRIFRLREDE